MTDSTTKTCTRCKQSKPLDQFSADKRHADGRQSQCKLCYAAKHREQRENDPVWKARQLESQQQSWTKRRQNPAFVEAERRRLNTYQRAMFQDPRWKQKRTAYYRVYNKSPERRRHMTDHFRAYRQHRQQNDRVYHKHLMGLARRGQHKRRALLAKSGGSYTEAQWNQLCALYHHCCVKCGANGPLSVDHIVPLSKGGMNDIKNLQPLCRSCNSRKHATIADYRPFPPVGLA